MGEICLYTLIALIIYQFRGIITKDYASLWSPMIIISLCYVYYVVYTYFVNKSDNYDIHSFDNDRFLVGSLVSFVSLMIGFSTKTKASFKKWNNTYSKNNIVSSAVLLFLIAFAGYASFRGVHFTFTAEENPMEYVNASYDHYFIELLLLHTTTVGLLMFCFKEKIGRKWLWFLFYYIVVTFLFAGTRSRLIYIAVVGLGIVYLYPKPRKPNYGLLAGLLVAMFILFSIMEYSRSYSHGIDMKAVATMDQRHMTKGAEENYSVFWFSSDVMNKYSETHNYAYFEPVLTAVLMPIPRAVFPWKPDAKYFMDAQTLSYGTSSGGAFYLYFVEGFISFGWLGLIFFSWFLGWLSKRFWDNYKNNPRSIGAIMALLVYNATCYAFVSRGYLASSLEIFIYTICLPFWIIRIAAKISPRFKS